MPNRKVCELMTTNVITVSGDAPFKDVVEKLMIHDISAVPVVDERQRLLGVVTEADLMSKEAHTPMHRAAILRLGPSGRWLRKAEGRTARDLMTPDPVTASPGESLRNAARRMMRTNVKRLPVVEDGRLVGILSRHDVLDVFDRSDASLRTAIENALLDLVFLRPPHAQTTVDVRDGIVTIAGTVRFTSDAMVAGNVAASVEGVVGIDNRLTARHTEPEILPL